MNPRYVDVVETAKLIRAQLARHYPGQSFRVRTSRFSGGTAIDIHWTDGPTRDEIERITKMYEGKRFDGMIDLGYTVQHWLLPDGTVTSAHSPGTEGSRGMHPNYDYPAPMPGAELVSFGCWVHAERAISGALLRQAAECYLREWGDADPSTFELVPERTHGKYTYGAYVKTDNYRVQERIMEYAYTTSTYTRPEEHTHEAQPVAPGSYAIEHDRDWTWIKFADKPSEAVRAALKAQGAKWSMRREAWYFTRHVESLELAA